jgi:hypothetical protein
MGWRGTLRRIEADANRAQRNAVRRRRELIRLQTAQAQLNELQRAAHEVEVYENLVELLTSLHKDCSDPLDWPAIMNQPHPEEPTVVHAGEEVARSAIDNFEPNFFVRLLGLTKWARRRLEQQVEAARAADEQATAEAQGQYRADCKEWERQTSLAKSILAADRDAVEVVLKHSSPFAEVQELGWQTKVTSVDERYISVVLVAPSEMDLPTETKSLLKSGKVSAKPMPKAKIYELFQEHICSVALRVGRELVALLPYEFAVAHVTAKLLNGATGHLEEATIVSVAMPRETVKTLDYEHIRCVDAMSNFVHEMSFKRSTGFERVEMVEAPG